MNTVLITGATGALGPAVVRAFAANAWRIRTLSRNPPSPGTPASEHEHIPADLQDDGTLCRAMNGADAVVHMAALLHVFDQSAGPDDYERVNVQGTASVMSAAKASGVRRVVGLITIAVYGPHEELVDEDSASAADTPYGASKLKAEREILSPHSEDGRPLGSVLRLAAVYGPNIKGNYERLVHALARGRFVPVGDGSNLRTLVFEDDAAQAILLAASQEAAAGAIFNVTDGEVYPVREIVGAISNALGRRPPSLRVPASVALAGVGVIESVFGMAGRRSPITKAALGKYLEHVAVSGARIRDRLGFRPQWTLAAGWRRTVERLRNEGRL
jgi:UDP-glucose 4-epimerase